MIIIKEIPIRDDRTLAYQIEEDILTVTMGLLTEEFDFTNLPEGVLEEIEIETLPLHPIISANKQGDIINISMLIPYGVDEKHLFEYEEDLYVENTVEE